MRRWINTTGAAFLLAVALATGADAAVRIEGGEGAFPTIQAAIDAAPDNAVIEIDSGSYPETLTIGKPLTLRGLDAGGAKPRLDGGKGPSAITITAADVTIDGLDISLSAARRMKFGVFSAYSEEACVMVRAGGAVISNSRMTGCHYGIFVRAGDGFTIEGNEIADNLFGGIMILNSRNGAIRGNRVDANAYGGISVGSVIFPPGMMTALRPLAGDVLITEETRSLEQAMSTDIEINGNTVSENGHTGIGIGGAARVRIVDNEAVGNGGAPVPRSNPPFVFGSSATIRGYGIGLICDARENQVKNNRATGNDSHGILLDTAFDNDVTANIVRANEVGIGVFGSTANRFADNMVTDNTGTGIRLERGLATNPPPVLNLLSGNDLKDNGINAYDTSGRDTAPARVQGTPKGGKLGASDLSRANQWDDGTRGNHFSDFDEDSEGFKDANGDGIGDTSHPIPGGKAVDRFPLQAAVKAGALDPALPSGLVLTACGFPGACLTDSGCQLQ
ncbi:MAG: right-handed parallel beta-helix repeat-containing protein [Arenimonas sp.]|nr:right-handed parallel beta-helix repeat-containing protein [Rhizobium sp.]MBW8446351.1 right-handed parallel beta-helix repeat-containing protein [Arenimonas sp.]